jgi:hypothetical protein
MRITPISLKGDLNGLDNKEQKSLESFFASFDLDPQHVLFRREGADKFLVVSTGGMIGHIEV